MTVKGRTTARHANSNRKELDRKQFDGSTVSIATVPRLCFLQVPKPGSHTMRYSQIQWRDGVGWKPLSTRYSVTKRDLFGNRKNKKEKRLPPSKCGLASMGTLRLACWTEVLPVGRQEVRATGLSEKEVRTVEPDWVGSCPARSPAPPSQLPAWCVSFKSQVILINGFALTLQRGVGGLVGG